MVLNIVCCWFTLAWDDSSSSCTTCEEINTKRCTKMSIADRGKYLHQNPITGVWMFQHRLEAFFSEYLLSDTHPLRYITDYVIKIEFQMRGSPHALAVGQRCSKNWQRSRWCCLCFHWQIHHSSDTSSNIWKWTSHQTHGQPTETYTFWPQSQKEILPFWFSKTPYNKNLNISTTSWWSWQNYRKCKITTTDCTKHTDNSKCT